jgi:hypothetical protein
VRYLLTGTVRWAKAPGGNATAEAAQPWRRAACRSAPSWSRSRPTAPRRAAGRRASTPSSRTCSRCRRGRYLRARTYLLVGERERGAGRAPVGGSRLEELVRDRRGSRRRPEPDRQGQAGGEAPLLVDRQGVPLAVAVTAAAVHDSRMLEPLPRRGPSRCGRAAPVRPRRPPAKLHGDEGRDYRRCRDACVRRGLRPRVARKGVERPGTRWVGTARSWERTLRGWPATAGSRSGTSASPSCTPPSSTSPARSSAGTYVGQT